MTSNSLLLTTVARVASPLIGLLALYFFLKGHNAPGGGFIAGLLVAAAVFLHYLAEGRPKARAVEAASIRWIVWGLLLAFTTGTVPALLGYSFFTHTFGHMHLPLIGDIELATAAIFDAGVLLVVVGNVVSVIRALTGDE